MRRRLTGLGIAAVAACMVASPSSAVGSGHCNEGQTKPSDVSGVPRDLAKATGLQALNRLNEHLGTLNQLDGMVPLGEVCELVP